MVSPIHAELSLHEHLRRKLAEQFPDIDEETLSDTVEGMTTLTEKLSLVTSSLLDDRSLATGLRHRIGDMQERLKRIESSAEKKKALVTEVMNRAQLKKLSEPEFTVSLRQSPPKLFIVAEDDIPEGYWKPQPPKLDRQSILSDLKNGDSLPGVSLDTSTPTISIRTK